MLPPLRSRPDSSRLSPGRGEGWRVHTSGSGSRAARVSPRSPRAIRVSQVQSRGSRCRQSGAAEPAASEQPSRSVTSSGRCGPPTGRSPGRPVGCGPQCFPFPEAGRPLRVWRVRRGPAPAHLGPATARTPVLANVLATLNDTGRLRAQCDRPQVSASSGPLARSLHARGAARPPASRGAAHADTPEGQDVRMRVSVAFAQPHQSPFVCFFLHGSSESNCNSGSGCPSVLFSRSTAAGRACAPAAGSHGCTPLSEWDIRTC